MKPTALTPSSHRSSIWLALFLPLTLAGLGQAAALGFSWRDYDHNRRSPSVQVSGGEPVMRVEAFANTRLPASERGQQAPAAGRVPLDPAIAVTGKTRVAFERRAASNAVVSDLWRVESPAQSTVSLTASVAGGAPLAVGAKPAGPADLTPPAEGTKVLLVTGIDYPGHPWRETAPVVRDLLQKDPRFKVRVVEDPNAIASPRLGEWDVILLHFMDWEVPGPGVEARENLRRVIAGGKGLMLTHFTCGAWDGNEWPEFVRLVGRVWDPKLRGHDPHGTFRVEIADPEHPITKGMASFETLDELYTCLTGDTPIHVIAKATSTVDQKDYPMAFVLNYERGRVFHTVLGHDARAYAAPGVGELLRRACAWAAGLPPQPLTEK